MNISIKKKKSREPGAGVTFRPGVEIYDSPNVSDDLDRLTHVSLAIIGVASIEKKPRITGDIHPLNTENVRSMFQMRGHRVHTQHTDSN